MNVDTQAHALDRALARGPLSQLPAKAHQQLRQVFTDVDTMARLDGDGQPAIEELKLRKLLRRHMAKAHEDSFVEGLKQLPGARFADEKSSKPLGWRAFSQKFADTHGVPVPAAPAAAVESAFINVSTLESARAAILQVCPTFPEELLDDQALRRVGQNVRARLRAPELTASDSQPAATASAVPPILAGMWTQFWACVVGAIGFWTAIGVMILLISVAVMVISSGGGLLPALAAAAYEIAGPILIAIAMTAVACAMGATFYYQR